MRFTTLVATLVATVASTAVTAAFVSSPAMANDPVPLVFTDHAADGNGLHDQGLGLGLTGTSTPVDASGFDIRKVTIVTDLAGSAATELLVTLELDAAPQRGGLYRVLSTVGGKCLWFEVTLDATALLDGSSIRRCDDSTTGYTYYNVTSFVNGYQIGWRVPLTAAGVVPGDVMSGLGADARLSEVAITVPSMDVASTTDTYTVGQ